MVLAHNIYAGRRTKDVQISQDVTFDAMLLATNTLQGLKDSGFSRPSPVQLHGIPLGKCGFDLLVEAKSGTGKTAVFSIIALEKLDLSQGLQVIIVAPTREIAAQIYNVIKQIGSTYEGLVVEVVMGGLSFDEDIKKFKKDVHIVVGSPGRLRYLIQDKHINISFVRLIVLDEVDKLMEKSFVKDINYIFSLLPDQKQVILSSATYTDSTKSFVSQHVPNAQHICPENNSILLGIEQNITTVKFNANIVRQTQYRFEELLKILSNKTFKQCLIFCNYQARVTELHKLLTKHKWPVEQLYGQQDQSDRLEALKTLQNYKCRILICSDLAARGIDASNVDLVINFEPPYEWQTYLHRIGRAGRYGLYGIAITILSEGNEEQKFKQMLQSMNLQLDECTAYDKKIKDADSNIQMNTLSNTNGLNNNTVDVDLKEIWQEYTDTSSHEVVEIESFETLCKAFDESIRLENFDEQVKSYDGLSKNEHKYQHMNICTKIFEALNLFLGHLKTPSNGIKLGNNLDNKPVCVKNIKDELTDIFIDHDVYDNIKTSKQEFCNKMISNYGIKTINKFNKCREKGQADACLESVLPEALVSNKEIQTNQSVKLKMGENKLNVISKNKSTKKENHQNCQYNTKSESYDNNLATSSNNLQSDLLLESGLPVAFISKKEVRRNQILIERNDSNMVAKNRCIENCRTNTNTYNTGFRAQLRKPMLSEIMTKSHKIRNRHVSNNDSHHNERGDDINYIKNVEHVRNVEYVNWYKQLKLRVNQIAYVLYMEEMSCSQYI